MSHSFYFIIEPLISLLLGGLQITAAVLLLRERGCGPWLMLIGGGISVVLPVALQILSRVLSPNNMPIYMVISAFGTLGSLLFGIGLLLHALQRRALGNRIADLEAILAARHGE